MKSKWLKQLDYTDHKPSFASGICSDDEVSSDIDKLRYRKVNDICTCTCNIKHRVRRSETGISYRCRYKY